MNRRYLPVGQLKKFNNWLIRNNYGILEHDRPYEVLRFLNNGVIHRIFRKDKENGSYVIRAKTVPLFDLWQKEVSAKNGK